MKAPVSLLLATFASLALGDVFLNVPTARGATFPICLNGMQVAKANGYDGVIFGAGTLNIPNITDNGVHRIDNPDYYAELRQATKEVLRLGLKAHVRLGVRWSGSGSARPYRPDESKWPQIARIWQNSQKAIDEECKAAGVSGPSRFTFELANEPGIGGANGPQYGFWSTARVHYSRWKKNGDKADFLKAFPEEFFGKPEGYIEPEFWRMLWFLRKSVSFGGYSVCAVNFEGDHRAEFQSAVGDDFETLMAGCSGFGLNRYGGDARSVAFKDYGFWVRRAASPAEIAQRWAAAVSTRIEWARAMPGMSAPRHSVWVAEMGFLESYAAPGWTANDYRQALIREPVAGIRMRGLFTFKSTNPLGTGFEVGDGVWP